MANDPLVSIIRDAFADRKCHDTATLAYLLGGTVTRGGSRTYRTFARDVLDRMEAAGRLERDRLGWWRLVASPEIKP